MTYDEDFKEFLKPFIFTFEDQEGNRYQIDAWDTKAMDKAMERKDWHLVFE